MHRAEDVGARRARAAGHEPQRAEEAGDDQRGERHRGEHQHDDAQRERAAVVLAVDRDDREHDQIGEQEREHAGETDPARP